MSVIAFSKNETSTPLSICFCALQGDDYACGKREDGRGKKSYLHFLSPNLTRSVQMPRHHQAWWGSWERLGLQEGGAAVLEAGEGKEREGKGRWPTSPGRGHGEGDTSQAMQGCLDMLSARFFVSKQLLQIPKRFRLEWIMSWGEFLHSQTFTQRLFKRHQ